MRASDVGGCRRGDIDVLEHPTRYGQVVPYRLLDPWITLRETKWHKEIVSLWDRQGKRYAWREMTHTVNQDNLGVVRRASVDDAFVTGDQVVLNVACFLLCMPRTYCAFCRCEKR